jgi:hypothetical protein
MFSASETIAMQVAAVEHWHQSDYVNACSDWLEIACQQHRYNYDLWHQEDIARSPDVSDSEIATVKRAIDKLNQQRNDWIEKLDDWLTAYLEEQRLTIQSGASQNSETPGSMIDRLSIIAIRIYHLDEQLDRSDIDDAHRDKVLTRSAICRVQQSELGQCLDTAIQEILSGTNRHRTYRQFKMYNDPSLNPYLYRRQPNTAKRAS